MGNTGTLLLGEGSLEALGFCSALVEVCGSWGGLGVCGLELERELSELVEVTRQCVGVDHRGFGEVAIERLLGCSKNAVV